MTPARPSRSSSSINEIHSVLGGTDGKEAYVVMVDNDEGKARRLGWCHPPWPAPRGNTLVPWHWGHR